MKKKLILILFIITVSFAFSLDETQFIDELFVKQKASFEDAVKAFLFLNEIKVSDDHDENVKNLQGIIKYLPKKHLKDKELTFGDFSLLAIRQLNIKSGLMYLATKNGRYAIRELMIIDLIPYNTSEMERMSGLDLIKYIEKVANYESKSKE